MSAQNADYGALEIGTPEAQLAWFRQHRGLRMTHAEWQRFYCESLEHKGLCCVSCADDEEYEGIPNYDDHCCCEGWIAASNATQIDSSGAAQ